MTDSALYSENHDSTYMQESIQPALSMANQKRQTLTGALQWYRLGDRDVFAMCQLSASPNQEDPSQRQVPGPLSPPNSFRIVHLS